MLSFTTKHTNPKISAESGEWGVLTLFSLFLPYRIQREDKKKKKLTEY